MLFVFAVVVTPREAFWAFGLYAAIVVAVALVAAVPLGRLARRLVIELPFLAFAFFLPFIGGGERVQVGFLSLSVAGLWGAWNILIKGTLGVAATALLGATTTVPELLRGLERLRMPKPIVAITSFMVRYGDVITRRHAADEGGPASPGGTTPAGCGRSGPWPRRPAPCSSAPTNGASGCTWPCSAGATTAPSRTCGRRRTPRRDWLAALAVPAAAAVICVAAVVTA